MDDNNCIDDEDDNNYKCHQEMRKKQQQQHLQKNNQKQYRHHHHNYHHRRRRHHHRHDHHHDCPRRNRSTDLSSTSIHTCHDSCPDREVREILIQRPCCSSSKTEIVQYFAEDLYGTTRRTSCCTSSDYYHTDSTSLYGSRSSLSRNNSIKSGSITLRRKRTQHQRQPSYGSVSLGRLNGSNPNSLLGSLTSIFDKTRDTGSGKMVVSPSKVTIEHQSKVTTNKDLPEYAYSPSPIRWSFLADSESKTPSDVGGATGLDMELDPSRKSDEHLCHKYRGDHQNVRDNRMDYEESNTVIFHQEGEAVNNCCNNYLQCNAFLDQDLQITSEDICEYLSKGNQGEILNNTINYPFQPTNALEFQYRNNFNISNNNNSTELRRNINNKETNLIQNNNETLTITDPQLSLTNINLSSSSNNINIIFNSYLEHNTNEVKFINTSRENGYTTEAHHQAYLSYSYPSYDNTNMSSNSLFDKPLGIDEIPLTGPITFGQTLTPAESLDTSSSNHNLIYFHYNQSQHDDGQQHNNSSHSTLSPTISTIHTQHEQQQQQQQHHHHHYYHHHRRWQQITDNIKFSNALRLVRKRARKCAQYLRKK